MSKRVRSSPPRVGLRRRGAADMATWLSNRLKQAEALIEQARPLRGVR